MPFPMEQQQEPDWCWNAVSVSVNNYFNPALPLTQDEFAVRALGADANRPFYLSTALADLELMNGAPIAGFLSFSEIQAQLDANLPVCVKIAWNEGGFHYLVITGYAVSPGGDPLVYISDPILMDSNVAVWDYNAFVFAYSPSYANAEGTWVDTLLVQP